MFRFGLKLKHKPSYPNLGSTIRKIEEIAAEMNLARDKQMEAERTGRKDIAAVQKARFEALLWVLNKDYATATVR